jgi:predicted GNAT family acetyltransferase
MDVEVVDQPDRNRYVALLDGEQAGLVTYRRDGDRIVFLHTEVDEAFEGRGVGSALVRRTLEEAREAGLTVVPRCPFYREWLERHPGYAEQVDTGAGGRRG